MKTVILKRNPAFSSYSLLHYLHDMYVLRTEDVSDYNWSVWDWREIHEGDRFYWVKVGMYGQTGIVGAGTITSEPYQGEDWSGKGRETYYVDFLPEVLLNPDALPILTCTELNRELPNFEWDKGHSGLVLTDEQAHKLDTLWQSFLNRNEPTLSQAHNKRYQEDLIYVKG